MVKSVEECYPELWHYTTVQGLHGILTSQQLWATNISFLNDSEEFIGFFDRRLLSIFKEGVRQCGLEFSEDNSLSIDDFSTCMVDAIRSASIRLAVYVTSFCKPTASTNQDGLLSQWRGYGVDGGYALVFDSQKIRELLSEEQKRYFYVSSTWGDVDYFDGEVDKIYKETAVWEQAIREAAADMFVARDPSIGEKLYGPVISLATRHKHRGFSEEAEVRFSAITSMYDQTLADARSPEDTRLKKDVHFTLRDGILVPHIKLFERPAGEKASLPIVRIIVGPHADKVKRKKAVELLLVQLGLDIKVETSDIPYVGR